MPIYVRRAGEWLDILTGDVAGTVTPPSATTTSIVTANPVVVTNPRDSLVPGSYQPGPSTTGVRPGRTLTVTSTHVPVSNTDYHDLDIRNTVDFFNKANCRYYDCIVRGTNAQPAGASGLATLHRAHGRGHEFWDCTVVPQLPSYRWIGFQGYGFKLYRCDVSQLVDAVQVFIATTSGQPSVDGPCGVEIYQSYFHDHAFFPPGGGGGETSPDGSHSDGIQWEGATGLIVKYNYFTGMLAPAYVPNNVGGSNANSSMQIAPDVGLISGADIQFNWFGGGAVTVNIADKPAKNRVIPNLGIVKNNEFLGGQFYPPSDIILTSSTSLNPGDIQADFGILGSTANHHTNGSAITITRGNN